MDTPLAAYLPQDRRAALAHGEALPEDAYGTALFADITGFTPLTEALNRMLGARRGVETMTEQINRVYTALVAEVERYGGSVIGFAGDSLTCWFSHKDERGTRNDEESDLDKHSSFIPHPSSFSAVACALALQQAMQQFTTIAQANGAATALALKVAVASGRAHRLVIGDPSIQLLDALAGATLDRMAAGEHLARQGEVLIDEPTATALGDAISVAKWRVDQETGALRRPSRIADFRLEIADCSYA